MDNINVILCGFLLASAVLTIFISIYSFVVNNTTIAKTFSLLCLSIAFYSIGYAMELYSKSLFQMLIWNLVQYIGIPFLPAFWLLLAIQYSDKDRSFNRTAKLFIYIIPFITLILRYTNNFHHLYYADIVYDTSRLFPVLFIKKGPWYLVQGIYMAFCILYSSYLYLQKFNNYSGLVRKQCIFMLTASVLPWITFFLDLFNVSPYGIDLAPFSSTISCILFLIVLFKYQFLDLKPLARDKMFECTDNGIIILDLNYNIIDFNPRAKEVLPALAANVHNKNINNVLGDNRKIIDAILSSSENQIEISCSDITNYYNIKTSEILNKNGQVLGFMVTITDVTKYVTAMKKLDYLASRDDLTGLFNKRYFVERSSYELDRAKRYKHAISYIIMDLDFFKNINDEYGHQAGDVVLKAVSGICLRSIRTIDILGRFGGEEFVIFLPETRLEESILIANRIRENIQSEEIIYENHIIKVTASFGVTGLNSISNETLNCFLKSADRALYKAKAMGRNCVQSEIPSDKYIPQYNCH